MTEGDPYASTGTMENAVDLKAAGIAEIVYYWKGKRCYANLAPSEKVCKGPYVGGKKRYMVAAYLVWRFGNLCAIHDPKFCIMGDNPFADPAKADFDHIDGDETNMALGNFRLACHPCNSHTQSAQNLQWKRSGIAASQEVREREKTALMPTGYAPIDLNVDLYREFIEWLERHLKLANGVPLEDAVYQSARQIHAKLGHGAHQTMRGYLMVLTRGDDAPYYIEEGTKMVKRHTTAKIAAAPTSPTLQTEPTA